METSIQDTYRGKFEELSQRDYFSPSFLDRFQVDDMPAGEKISVVVPTYNRSPHSPEEDLNPLGWCLESLANQRGNALGEVVVVDDASTDYTKEVFDQFNQDFPVPMSYVKHDTRQGSPRTKNRGVEESSYGRVLFSDDDCIFSPYALFGTDFTFERLPKDAAALHLPVYQRKKKPNLISRDNIGVLDLEEGVMAGNHSGFPEEYLDSKRDVFLDDGMKIFSPLEIKQLAGIFATDKEAFTEAGGFPEWFSWGNGYREETEFALNLAEKGYRAFFTPDPKFHSVHLKYGAEANLEGSKNGLTSFIEESNVAKEHTGNRVSPSEWMHGYILSTSTILGKRNPQAADRFLHRIYRGFVNNNDLTSFTTSFTNGTEINPRSARKKIFDSARKESRELIAKLKK